MPSGVRAQSREADDTVRIRAATGKFSYVVPVALASSAWWMARQLLRVLTGLATTALALTLVVHGGAAAAAVPSTPDPMCPAVVQLPSGTDRQSVAPTVRSDRLADGATLADHLIVVEGTGPVPGSPRRPGAGRVGSPVREPAGEPHAAPLGQRAPPRA
jgi:hypothetical protein